MSDHAEAYGAMVELRRGNPLLLADPTVKRWHDMIQKGGKDSNRRGIFGGILVA